MADSLDAVIDAAMPAAIEAATEKPSEPTSTAWAPSVSASSAPAATSGTEAAPTPTGTTGPATTAQTASDGKPSSESDEPTADELAKGVPPERLKRIVQNTRDKAQSQVYEGEIGYTPDEYRTLKPWVDLLAQDGVAAYHAIGARLRQQGLLNDAAPAQAPPPVAARPVAQRPQPDLRAEDGTLAYSAPAMEQLLQWQAAQINGQLDERFKPFDEMQHERKVEQIHNHADKLATAAIAQAETWEGWNDLKPKVAAMMQRDGRHTLNSAYNALLPAYLKERDTKLKAEARQQTLDEIAAKPKAPGKSVAPSAATVGNRQDRRRLSTDDKMDAALAQFSQ